MKAKVTASQPTIESSLVHAKDVNSSQSTSSLQSTESPTIENQSFLFQSQNQRDAITRAEIIYAFKLVDTYSSMRSADHCGEMFKAMFPDSVVAEGFKMSKDKASYVINFGLGEFYKEEANETINQCDYFVVQFDESLNKVAQRGQMDMHIRYIDSSNLVNTKYITSAFIGHATAQNLFNALKSCFPSNLKMPFEKIIQLGMNGPTVN